MQNKYRRKIVRYARLGRYRSIWRKCVQVMAFVVVFCTTYALILPAITMERTHFCGLEAHEHTDDCYIRKETLAFTCTPGEGELHLHEDRCFDALGYQICPYSEKTEHIHTDNCYKGGSLICGREEVQLHIHTEDCMDEAGLVICTMPELTSHTHSEACTLLEWEEDLVCTQEVHIHDPSCDSDPEADLETQEDWERSVAHVQLTGNWAEDLVAVAESQIGYQESTCNYLLEEDGTQKGYTRYGDWYGVPYGSWDAMFVSFCMDYAGIPQEAISCHCNSREWFENLVADGWINVIPDSEIAAGDVAFFGNENGNVTFAAIITEAQWDTGEDHEPLLYLQFIAGDAGDEVAECFAATMDIPLLGFVSMEKVRQQYDAQNVLSSEVVVPDESAAMSSETDKPEPAETTERGEILPSGRVTRVAETENYIVTVTYSESVTLPEGAALQVVEYSRDSEIFYQRSVQAGYELEWLLNIGFFLEDTEIILDGGFDVIVASKQGKVMGSDITHFADSGTERISGEAVTEDGQAAVAFTSDGFSDFGGGIALAAETAVYSFKTANPADLKEGVDYAVYFGTNNNYTFLTTTSYLDAAQVSGAQYWTSPYTVGNNWELTPEQLGTQNLSHIAWRVVKSGNQYYLVSRKDNQRLTLAGSTWMSVNGSALTNSSVNGAGTKIASDWYGNTYYMQYSNGWKGTSSSSNATTMYFAEVSQTTSSGGTDPTEPPTETTVPTDPAGPAVPGYPNYPQAVGTGDVNISRLRFYNICENGDSGISALAGCVFEIVGDNGYQTTVLSENTPEVNLPADIPDGNYTITEISVPNGYMRDTDYQRTFTVEDGMLVSDKTIGTFINHDLRQLASDKTAEVKDYNNRIYQVLLSAESHMRMYEMDPVDVLFVVDQSNSMLFPSGLNSTGKSVSLRLDGAGNVSNMEALNLDKNQVYYIISDPTGTSTVWAVWYNGQSWIYQDASYYAKAWYENGTGYQDPNETAIFPKDRSYADQSSKEDGEAGGKNVRANGGGLGYSLSGGGLGNYIDTFTGDVATFEVYTASGEYNRLHYLEEALTNMIYTLADVNDQNRVTLIEFTKEVDEVNDCMGPLVLTPDNMEDLVYKVRHINTSGGTRQDIALAHVYNDHLNNADLNYHDLDHTYTILITDGAPVRSSGSELSNVGSPDDPASTTADSIYAQIKGYAALVRQKSALMTVGLGMDKVEGGKQVLQEIATNENFNCALDDAADLVKQMQDMMFEAFRPKDQITMTGDVVDEISDSFYPIAFTDPGGGAATGRRVLVQNVDQDWILLESGDWITLEGRYTTAGASDAAGQLLRRDDGTFYIQWLDVQLSYPDPENPYEGINTEGIAWVAEGSGSGTGRTVIATYGGKDWIQLNERDYISQEGQYYSGTPSYWDRSYYGQYTSGSINWGRYANGKNRIVFDASQVALPETPSQWHGTFYVKAKEDFIGGNAINTNKQAKITATVPADDYVTVEKYLETPTVNVHLLDMNEMHSEVTVYLGDIVNEEGRSPLESLQFFFDNTHITKLISDGGDVLNKVTVEDADGLEEAVFYIRYALGRDLTDEEWQTLASGEAITIPYVYDNPSSRGPVGEFTFRLEKSGMEGATPDFAEHEATAACQPDGQPLTENCNSPAETYTLHITYEAYGLGEKGRPANNVHNGTGSPGTEVGTGSTLETGVGIVEKENVHEVHVISGAIKISKKFADELQDEQDRTFTFILHRMEDGEDTTRDVTKTITIPAGASAGTASAAFDGLRRGTYTVTEAPDEAYMVESVTVLNTTNCYSEPAIGGSAQTLTFVMGNNMSNDNVIGRASEKDAYASYIDPVNGVFGEAVFTNKEIVYTGDIPVIKIWDDGPEAHGGDAVYVVLYLDDSPVRDAEGRARILRLDAQSNWQGVFEVALSDKTDRVTNYKYSVREVSQISDDRLYRDTWHSAVLENDDSLVYYEKALEAGGVLGVNGRGYMVQYAPGENGGWTVTNFRTVELPSTGGMGTHLYTFSGLLVILAALMYGYSQRRKRERGDGR